MRGSFDVIPRTYSPTITRSSRQQPARPQAAGRLRRPGGLWSCALPLLVAAAALAVPAKAQSYTISTIAGRTINCPIRGLGDGGLAVDACLNQPNAVASDSSGNIYIADTYNGLIRKVAADGTISTVAGSQSLGAGYSGDGGLATKAQLGMPSGILVDSSGNLYIADSRYDRVRKVTSSGIISTVAGGGTNYTADGDGGAATDAVLNQPEGLAMDTAGNLYVADTWHYKVRKVSPSGVITTIAGSGYSFLLNGNGDGGAATSAAVMPDAVALDSAGNLYIADQFNNRIRKVNASGIISTLVGTGSGSYSGDGGLATKAGVSSPYGVAVDSGGNIYIADTYDNRIRIVATNGSISTIAGDGSQGNSGDGGAATGAEFYHPQGVTVTSTDRILIADTYNNRVRKLTNTASATAPSITSGGLITASAFGASTSVAPGSWIEIYGKNLAADSRSWTGADFNGTTAPTSLDGTSITIGGKAAYLDYISPGQVNAQVPSGIGTGSLPVVVTTASGSSSAYTVNVNLEQPGLLAPYAFAINGKQYVAALFSDGTTYVLPPGAISGVNSRRAKAGDVITLYGVGFGTVQPDIQAGHIASGTNSLTAAFHILFNGTEATVNYAGLAPAAVGLYQFNVVVPNVTSGDLIPLTFNLAGTAGSQTLYIPVQ